MRVEVDILRVATRDDYTAHMSSIQVFSRAEFLRLIASTESRPVLRKNWLPPFPRMTGWNAYWALLLKFQSSPAPEDGRCAWHHFRHGADIRFQSSPAPEDGRCP